MKNFPAKFNKFVFIFILSIALTLASQLVSVKYIYVVSPLKCPFEIATYSHGGCYGVTTAKGFPYGYIPWQTTSGFDDFNFEFDGIHFILDSVFYYVVISGVVWLYNRKKSGRC